MNKNFAVTLVAIVLILVGGGLAYSVIRNKDTSPTATSTPQVLQNNNNPGVNNSSRATVPLVVTNPSVSPSSVSAIVSGNVNPKGAFTSYWYEYGKTSGLEIRTPNQTMGSGFTSIQAPAYITGLSKSTTYYFRLVAENQYGKVAGSQYTFETTEGTPPPVGNAPTTKTLSANNISSTTANINGEVTPNKSEAQYWFEYGQTPELGNTSAFSSAGNGTTKSSVSISLSDLKSKTTYYFRLNAQNQFGTINGSILNFKTK